MGDMVGEPVTGTLYCVGQDEFERALALPAEATKRTALFAALCRINALYMIARAGSGHIGSSFSHIDILSWLLLNEMKRTGPKDEQDIYFSSKGHDAPAYYAAMIGLGELSADLVHKLRRLDGLPGHPDVSTSCVAANSGSLGMGISKAKGMAFANRRLSRDVRIYVLTGDGELQEGQIWESLISAANHRLHEITVVVDHNKFQSDRTVRQTSDLGDIVGKLAAFGWHVQRCDGHDLSALSAAFRAARSETARPSIIVADTVKGKGVKAMEGTSIDSDVEMYKFHSGSPQEEIYLGGVRELQKTVNALLAESGAEALKLESVERPPRPASPQEPERMVAAYGEALLRHARIDARLVALDADLILDTGLIPFMKELPEQFVECGIAEQDMVSQAGGIALKGLLPVVHSFSCFLAARPNEQIYNNATEQTRVVYVGSLAGLLPAGPGHSHQAVRDIAALRGIPNLIMMEPSCAAETTLLTDFCLSGATENCYLRLVSIPCQIPYALPREYVPGVGRGCVLRDGTDVALIGYGPVLLPQACLAAERLADCGISAKVINLPWLNRVDVQWLRETLGDIDRVLMIDNHSTDGGQGDTVISALATSGELVSRSVMKIGVTSIPRCGTNDEVLAAHGLDAAGIMKKVLEYDSTGRATY